jgi:hypothetical protein
MKKWILPVVCAAVLPLSAQQWEVGAFLGYQDFKPLELNFYHSSATYSEEPESKLAYGFRGGLTLADLEHGLVQITVLPAAGEHMPENQKPQPLLLHGFRFQVQVPKHLPGGHGLFEDPRGAGGRTGLQVRNRRNERLCGPPGAPLGAGECEPGRQEAWD